MRGLVVLAVVSSQLRQRLASPPQKPHGLADVSRAGSCRMWKPICCRISRDGHTCLHMLHATSLAAVVSLTSSPPEGESKRAYVIDDTDALGTLDIRSLLASTSVPSACLRSSEEKTSECLSASFAHSVERHDHGRNHADLFPIPSLVEGAGSTILVDDQRQHPPHDERLLVREVRLKREAKTPFFV